MSLESNNNTHPYKSYKELLVHSASRTLKKRRRRRVIFLSIVIFIAIMFFALRGILFTNIRSTGNNVYVLNVKGCNGNLDRDNIVCSNGIDFFINAEKCIYKYADDELIVIRKFEKLTVKCIGATDKFIIYSDYSNNVYRIDLETGDEILLLENVDVEDIITNKNDYFLEVSYFGVSDSLYDYGLILYEGDSIKGIDLNQFLEPVKEDTSEAYEMFGVYGDYNIYGGTQELGVAKETILVEGRGWQGSVSRLARYSVDDKILVFNFDSYIYDGKEYKIELVNELFDNEVGIFTALSAVKDNNIYALVQYGKGYSAGGPNPIMNEFDAIISISPSTQKENLIYKTKNGASRIVGFDMDENVVYLYCADAKLYRVDLNTGKKTVLMKDLPNKHVLYFDWCEDRLFVFDKHDGYKLLGTVK